MVLKNIIFIILFSFFGYQTSAYALSLEHAHAGRVKVLLVVAHDIKQSLTYSLYDAISDYLATKHTVELLNLDLYDYAAEIPFYRHDPEFLEESHFFKQNRELILQADRVILFFPVYWYSTPAIVKARIDLITNYAWAYKSGVHAEPLHHITKVLSVNSAIAKRPWYAFFIEHPAQRQITDTFRFMGVPYIKNYMIHDVYKINPTSYHAHLETIKKLVDELVI